MSGFTDRNCFAVAVLIYGISATYSIFLLRRELRHHNRLNYFTLLAAFGFHTGAMLMRGFSLDRCPINNLYEATMFVAWTMTATYLVIGLWPRLRFLGAFAAPILFAIGVFALLTPKDVGAPGHPEFSGGWLTLHVAMFALAYGAFGLSSVAGLMYLTQERDLKLHKMRALLSIMPPIQRLELIIRALLVAGFVLLTGALVVSAVFMQQQGRVFTADFKIFWALFVWVLYLALIVMRWKFWRGGRRFAWGSIAAFAFVLLTFWGSSLMSPLHRP
ncbi:MAG TPA: cytochrome c biogenesis protein CcsA [Candidatus Limnocylindria bacterium]|nr:cytochrome c biogenesis protein CcsA [Candidatus Limnocylindria bacterium]